MNIPNECNNFININKLKDEKNLELNHKIEKLKIPPNWKNVYISDNFHSKIQAFGYDDKNRKQYIYHPCWKSLTNEIKFKNTDNFNIKKLNAILCKYKKDILQSKLYVISNMLQLMIDLNIRVGNEIYLKENDTTGLCTMQKKNFKDNSLCFKGKRGVIHTKILDNKHIEFIRNLLNLPGKFLFQYLDNSKIQLINSNDLNDFLKIYVDKNLSTKDIRTYQANQLFKKFINENKKNFNNLKKLQTAAIKYTSEELGNTIKVCKDSYINPNNLIYK